jgi:predicted HTH domain antitoxin
MHLDCNAVQWMNPSEWISDMASVTFDVPDEFLARLWHEGQNANEVLLLAAAFSLCSRGQLSTSQAARLAGRSYADFLLAAAQARIELYPVNMEELKEEAHRGFTLGRQCIAGDSVSQGGTL